MPRLLLNFCTERPALWRVMLVILFAAITYLALSPAPPKTVTTGWDKSNHALAFAALAFSSVWALWQRPRQWVWLVLALVGYGIAIEIAQGLLPPREADWRDVLADSLGIALGLAAAWPITASAARRH